MRLAGKFNLIIAGSFGLGLIAASAVSYYQLKESAHSQVVANARIMLETALAVRSFTTDQIQPIVKDNWTALDDFFVKTHLGLQQVVDRATTEDRSEFHEIASRVLDTGKRKLQEMHDNVFYPQTVPAFAATESFRYLQREYPQYRYKEAALNPTNPQNLAEDWERELIERFRGNPELTEWIGERESDGEQLLYLAHPITIKKEACLTCHSSPGAAPVAMVKRYGSARGFGWKMNEIIGAQFVSVPTSLPTEMASKAFKTLVISLALVFIATLIILNIALLITVVRPVRALSHTADTLSKGDLSVPEAEVSGNDEISVLSASFNRMRRSLEKALKMLE
ncbi:MAG: signal protein [Proteobacteria bacterium]|nr:MAG: signal protein [Pseudomonadota bacterium]